MLFIMLSYIVCTKKLMLVLLAIGLMLMRSWFYFVFQSLVCNYRRSFFWFSLFVSLIICTCMDFAHLIIGIPWGKVPGIIIHIDGWLVWYRYRIDIWYSEICQIGSLCQNFFITGMSIFLFFIFFDFK